MPHQCPEEAEVCSCEVQHLYSATVLPHSLQELGIHYSMVMTAKDSTDDCIPGHFFLVCKHLIQVSIMLGSPSGSCAKKLP